MHKPTNAHWATIKYLLHYLKETATNQLFFSSTTIPYSNVFPIVIEVAAMMIAGPLMVLQFILEIH